MTTDRPDADHPFHDEWARQPATGWPGELPEGREIAPHQPCFTCGVVFADHATRPIEADVA